MHNDTPVFIYFYLHHQKQTFLLNSFFLFRKISIISIPLYTFTEEEEKAVQNALLSSCKVLEEARCLKSEGEANLMMASTLLSNHGKAEVDISKLPGGIQDAWVVLSETTQPAGSKTELPCLSCLEKKEYNDM